MQKEIGYLDYRVVNIAMHGCGQYGEMLLVT